MHRSLLAGKGKGWVGFYSREGGLNFFFFFKTFLVCMALANSYCSAAER